MQCANCWLVLNQFGSNVPLRDVTPAEAVILRNLHQKAAGRFPLHDFGSVSEAKDGEDKRSDLTELNRLKAKYGPKVVETAFPGDAPTLPATFKAAGIETSASVAPAVPVTKLPEPAAEKPSKK